MKTNRSVVPFFVTIACLLAASGCQTPRRPTPILSFPTADYDIENAVPTGTLGRIADSHAAEVWGSRISRGRALPLVDESGKIVCYMFSYARQAERFPKYADILAAVRTFRSKHLPSEGDSTASCLPRAFFDDLHDELGQFGSVYVAATEADFPILVVMHSLHPYFLVGEAAQQEAQRATGRDQLSLSRIYFLGPHEEYFEFVDSSARILVHPLSLKTYSPDEVLEPRRRAPMPPEVARRKAQAWRQMKDAAPLAIDADEVAHPHTHKVIPYSKLIPVVDWTWWCVPTATTMVAGFWDNYTKGVGTISGYGRIIDYWFDHSSGNNVPNFIDEIIDPTTKTWSANGFLGTLNNTNGYNYTWEQVKGTSQNDWAWPALKGEIDNGRPAKWGVAPVNPHAMAAFGYRTTATQKFVIVYNTWGPGPQQQLAEYNYDQWSGSPVTKTDVGRLLPGGGTGKDHAILISPDGGEVLLMPSTIVWFVWGNEIKKTKLSFSSDGGKSWSPIANVVTKPGWNTYTWKTGTLTTKARVKIACNTTNGKLIAADGSQTNFYIQANPDLVPVGSATLPGPIGFCLRDDKGKLVVKVRNQGTLGAPASTTKIEFLPGGSVFVATPAIPAGGTAELAVKIPIQCFNPDCEFEITVDTFDDVKEANEANNIASGSCIG